MQNKDTFSPETKQSIFQAQNGICKGTLDPIHSFHHKLKNTVANRKRFPLFIHSVFNCVGLGFNEHANKSHKYKITEQEAEVYEKFLQDLQCEVAF